MAAFVFPKPPGKDATGAPDKSGKASGVEMMLRGLGLGEFLDAIKLMATPENVATIKQLLDSKTVDKLLKFADDIEEQNVLLRQIRDRFDAQHEPAGTADAESTGAGKVISGRRGNKRTVEPGPCAEPDPGVVSADGAGEALSE